MSEWIKKEDVEEKFREKLSKISNSFLQEYGSGFLVNKIIRDIVNNLPTKTIDEPEFNVGDEFWYRIAPNKLIRGKVCTVTKIRYTMKVEGESRYCEVSREGLHKTKELAEQALAELNK